MTKSLQRTLMLAAIWTAGCGQFHSIERGVAEYGAELQDQILADAIFIKCRAASVGAIQRRYATNPQVWSSECTQGQSVLLPEFDENGLNLGSD